jgi:endonuclease YncB( thermonuclease family)
MIGLMLFIALQSTDFGVREVGKPVPQKVRSKSVRSIPGAATFSCSVARITDGDTLRCSDGTRVRIAGIDAPEVAACAPGRKCTPGDATASKRSLAAMASGKTLNCRKVGKSYDRTVAFCSAGDTDLSCAQVKAGQAVQRYARKDEVCR